MNQKFMYTENGQELSFYFMFLMSSSNGGKKTDNEKAISTRSQYRNTRLKIFWDELSGKELNFV